MNNCRITSLKKIGYTLRFHRRKLNLSQFEMASELNISARNLQRLENGEVEPKLETLHKISSFLKIPLHTIIRPTDFNDLFIYDVSTEKERKHFRELSLVNYHNNDDLRLTEKLIVQDFSVKPTMDSVFQSKIEGNIFLGNDDFLKFAGISTPTFIIDDYSAYGTSVERWEIVFRKKIKKALINSCYHFPSGFKALEVYHYNVNPNPESPTSENYIRDVTARHQLEFWLKKLLKKENSL